jgi:hypothetical protein
MWVAAFAVKQSGVTIDEPIVPAGDAWCKARAALSPPRKVFGV